MEYERNDEGAWLWRQGLDTPTGPETLLVQATDVRRQTTGIHASLAVLVGETRLAWGKLNIEKDEERVRLANSAHARLNGHAAIDKGQLKKLVDDFAHGLWDATLGELAPGLVGGSEQPTAVQFALRPFVVEGGGTIIFGHPGRGKSYVSMLMAVALDAGLAIPPALRLFEAQPRRVLWINLERDARGVQNRLGNVNAVLGLPRTRGLLMMNARGRSFADILPAAEKAMRAGQADVVFLDSVSRAGLGDLNENQAANRIVDGLNRLSRTWVGIAHAARGSDEHVFGSVHFEAGADVVVRLISQQEEAGPLGVGLKIVKENDVGKFPLRIVALEFDQLGLRAARAAHDGEFPEVEAERKTSMRSQVIDYLKTHGPATASHLATALGFSRERVSALLANDGQAFVKTQKQGRDQLYGLLAREHFGGGLL